MSPTRFSDLSIHGFRRLQNVDFPLRPLNVMIGANSIGKTSVLDVLSLLASSAQGKLSASITDLSGLTSVLTYDRADELRLGISMEVPKHEPLKYSVELRPQGIAYVIADEKLSQLRPGHPDPFRHIDSHGVDVKYFELDRKKLVRPNWEHNPLETSLSQVPKMFQEPEDFRKRLASSTFYDVLNVDPRSPVRLPQPMQPATLPGRNGEDLVSCLYTLSQTEGHRFEAIEDALRTAFPRFDHLKLPAVAAGTLALAWWETGFSRPLYMHQLSEGTLRFLWLATLLQSPGLTTLTLLDEPEVSLHPELLGLLADLLREASRRTQLIVATHSDRLIRFLQPKEVVAMDTNDDGMTTLTWADELDLQKMAGRLLARRTLEQWSTWSAGLKISILVEGKTEEAFKPHLVSFLQDRLAGRMPRLDIFRYDGRIPKEEKLRRTVENLLSVGKPPSDAVIALSDVYTGTKDFLDAEDAKRKMREWVGNNDRFYPHVALHDFEAWLLPFWSDIQKLAGHDRKAPLGPLRQ